MDTYGNAAKQPDSDEARLLLGQTEGYVEYNAAGRVIKGEEVKARLKLEAHCGIYVKLLVLNANTQAPRDKFYVTADPLLFALCNSIHIMYRIYLGCPTRDEITLHA